MPNLLKRWGAGGVACLTLILGGSAPSANAAVTDAVLVERVANGLSRPVFATSPPGDFERLFIVEQHTGQIRVLDLTTGSIAATPFLTQAGLSTGSEQGLLGLAFHPQYDENGLFYVNYTAPDRATQVVRYQVSPLDPNVANPASASPVLSFAQPQPNHNGGWLGFGPDGYLYIAAGDGGGSNDNDSGHTAGTGNAQDITSNWLGKILRVDVNGDDFPADAARNYAIPASNPFVGVTGDDEIWAYGLRNPWRPSFDRATGDLYIADVGQNTREEVDYQPADSTGGENYGWRLREGTIATPGPGIGGPPPPGAVEPVYDYSHGLGPTQGFSISGGYVYRGPIQPIQGKYFFADYVTEGIWSIEHDGVAVTEFIDWTDSLTTDVGSIGSIASFGEDAAGNLYVIDLGGEVFRFVPVCTLELALGYEAATLSLDFDLELEIPVTWTTFGYAAGAWSSWWSVELPAIAPTSIPLSLPGFPSVGIVAVLSLFTSDGDVMCADFDFVDTGS